MEKISKVALFALLITYPEILCAADWGNVKKSIVRIVCKGDKLGTGTGWAINAEGYFITNNHVIACTENGGKIAIWLSAMASDRHALSIIWADKVKDLAIVKAETLTLPGLPLLPVQYLASGESIKAIGYPGVADSTLSSMPTDADFYKSTITKGGESRKVKTRAGVKIIQMDASINPGNSGGPLLNDCGHVVGINTFIPNKAKILLERGQIPEGFGFAVQSNELIPELKRNNITYNQVSETCQSDQGRDLLTTVGVIASLILGGFAVFLTKTTKGRELVQEAKEVVSRRLIHSHEPSRKSQFILKGVSGSYRDCEIELDSNPLFLGRDPRLCQLVFPPEDSDISKRHAVVTYNQDEGKYYLEDCWSRNGTFIIKGSTGIQRTIEEVKPGDLQKLEPGDSFYMSSQDNGIAFLEGDNS